MLLSFVISFGKDEEGGGGLLNLQISVIAPRPSQFSTLLEKNIPLKNTALFNTYISRKYHAEANQGISKGGGAVYAPSHIPYVFVMHVKNQIYIKFCLCCILITVTM